MPEHDYAGGHDGPFLLIVEHDSVGVLYFGPFRMYDRAEKMIARIERLAPSADWSIEAMSPGSYAPEWARIITDHDSAASGAQGRTV